MLETSIKSNQNNQDGSGGLFRPMGQVQSHSKKAKEYATEKTPLHQLVVHNRISILRHFATTNDKQPETKTKGALETQTRIIITPQHVVNHGLIFTAIQHQHFEMCQFLLTQLYHPSTTHTPQLINITTHRNNNDDTIEEEGRKHLRRLLPIQFCCEYSSKNNKFWKQIFPYLLEKGFARDIDMDMQIQQQTQHKQKRKDKKKKKKKNKKRRGQEQGTKLNNLCDDNDDYSSSMTSTTTIGGLFKKDSSGCNTFDIISQTSNCSIHEAYKKAATMITTIPLLKKQPLPLSLQLLQGYMIEHCHHNHHHHCNLKQQDSSLSNDNVHYHIEALLINFPSSLPNKDIQYPKNQLSPLPLPQQTSIHIGAKYGLKWGDGMMQIVEANLSHILKQDPTTGLLPFALAAVTSIESHNTNTDTSSGNEKNPSVNPDYDLNSIYSLMRYRPDCLLQVPSVMSVIGTSLSKKKKSKRKRKNNRNSSRISSSERRQKRRKKLTMM